MEALVIGWIVFCSIVLLILGIRKFTKYKKLCYLILTMVIVVFAGFRYNIGYDYDNYIEVYKKIIENNEGVKGVEFGWKLIVYMANLFNSPQLMFLISSVVIYYTVLKKISEYSEEKYTSVIIFLFTVFYFWESLSIIRQYIAIAFFFIAVKYIFEKKIWKYTVLILIGAMFHKSILFLLPVYFFARLKFKKMAIYIAIASTSIISIVLSNFIMMFDMLMQYQVYVNGGIAQGKENSGLSLIIRILILILIVFFKDRLDYEKDIKKRVFINLYFIGTLFFITFYSSTAIRRIGYYLMIFEIIVIPLLIAYKEKKNYIMVLLKYKLILIYFAYIFYGFYNDVYSRSSQIIEDSQKNRYYQMNFIGSYFDKNIGE